MKGEDRVFKLVGPVLVPKVPQNCLFFVCSSLSRALVSLTQSAAATLPGFG